MKPLLPIETVDLFPILNDHLLDLLRGLAPDDWQRPTVCKGWTVKDIVSHIIDGNWRRITLYRDHYQSPDIPVINSYESLVQYLNQLNQDWVVSTRRLSPAILIDWLAQTGPVVHELFKQQPPFEAAPFSVAWAGEETSLNWFHIAREYTELWHHQQQIRLALDQTDVLMSAELHHPLLDTFMRALPHTFRHVSAQPGTLVTVTITGPGGDTWYLLRRDTQWALVQGAGSLQPTAAVELDGAIAWRLFTKGLSADDARPYLSVSGDQILGTPVLQMLSVMA